MRRTSRSRICRFEVCLTLDDMEYNFFVGSDSDQTPGEEPMSDQLDLPHGVSVNCVELHVLCWVSRSREKFIFLCDDETGHLLEPTLIELADNPELSFNRVDAALLMAELRKQRVDAEIIGGEGVDPSRLFDDLKPVVPKELEWKF